MKFATLIRSSFNIKISVQGRVVAQFFQNNILFIGGTQESGRSFSGPLVWKHTSRKLHFLGNNTWPIRGSTCTRCTLSWRHVQRWYPHKDPCQVWYSCGFHRAARHQRLRMCVKSLFRWWEATCSRSKFEMVRGWKWVKSVVTVPLKT